MNHSTLRHNSRSFPSVAIRTPLIFVLVLGLALLLAKQIGRDSNSETTRRFVIDPSVASIKSALDWYAKYSPYSLNLPWRCQLAVGPNVTAKASAGGCLNLELDHSKLAAENIFEQSPSTGQLSRIAMAYRPYIWWEPSIEAAQTFLFAPFEIAIDEVEIVQENGDLLQVRFRAQILNFSPFVEKLENFFTVGASKSVVQNFLNEQSRLLSQSVQATVVFKKGLYGYFLPLAPVEFELS